MRKRLLAVDVFAQLHRPHAGHGVRMIGRADGDRVDVFALEQLAKVGKLRRLGEFGTRFAQPGGIDVANRDDVLIPNARHVDPAFAAHADAADVELLVRRLRTHSAPSRVQTPMAMPARVAEDPLTKSRRLVQMCCRMIRPVVAVGFVSNNLKSMQTAKRECEAAPLTCGATSMIRQLTRVHTPGQANTFVLRHEVHPVKIAFVRYECLLGDLASSRKNSWLTVTRGVRWLRPNSVCRVALCDILAAAEYRSSGPDSPVSMLIQCAVNSPDTSDRSRLDLSTCWKVDDIGLRASGQVGFIVLAFQKLAVRRFHRSERDKRLEPTCGANRRDGFVGQSQAGIGPVKSHRGGTGE